MNTGVGSHFLLQGNLPDPGINPPALPGGFFTTELPGNPMDRGAWWATVHGVAIESDMT